MPGTGLATGSSKRSPAHPLFGADKVGLIPAIGSFDPNVTLLLVAPRHIVGLAGRVFYLKTNHPFGSRAVPVAGVVTVMNQIGLPDRRTDRHDSVVPDARLAGL